MCWFIKNSRSLSPLFCSFHGGESPEESWRMMKVSHRRSAAPLNPCHVSQQGCVRGACFFVTIVTIVTGHTHRLAARASASCQTWRENLQPDCLWVLRAVMVLTGFSPNFFKVITFISLLTPPPLYRFKFVKLFKCWRKHKKDSTAKIHLTCQFPDISFVLLISINDKLRIF